MHKKIATLAFIFFPLAGFAQFYGGLDIGWTASEARVKSSFNATPLSSVDLGKSGALLGGHLGYNHHLTDLVFLGLELNGGVPKAKPVHKNLEARTGDSPIVRFKGKGYGSLSTRFGVKLNNTRLYARVGYVRSKYTFTETVDSPLLIAPKITNKNFTKSGVSVGVGVTTELTKNFSIGLIFSHTFYGSKSLSIRPRTYKVTPSEHTAMLQLSYCI